MRKAAAALANLGVFLLPFLLLEGAFRLLPVSDLPPLAPVNAGSPVARFAPDLSYRYSRDWNFSIVTHKRSNNYGFIQATDFEARPGVPLLAVIGDSFVEANAVDAGQAVAELLDAGLAGRGRTYGLGMSGAPLSQYLVYADYARATFAPAAMAFVIIGNDFDESLLKYKRDARFHYFADDGTLRRIDYRLSPAKQLLRHSAALRYVLHNLEAVQRLQLLVRSMREETRLARLEGEALEQRLADSRRAVDLFFAQLPARSGLAPQDILFVLDGVRPELYDEQALAAAGERYHERMRRYFAAQARARGYAVLDMQPVFIARHRRDGARFEAASTDSHWNALAHRLAAEEIRKSAVYRRTFSDAGAAVARQTVSP